MQGSFVVVLVVDLDALHLKANGRELHAQAKVVHSGRKSIRAGGWHARGVPKDGELVRGGVKDALLPAALVATDFRDANFEGPLRGTNVGVAHRLGIGAAILARRPVVSRHEDSVRVGLDVLGASVQVGRDSDVATYQL